MKKAIWGSIPPQFERYSDGIYRVYYNLVPFERKFQHIDEEGNTTEEITTAYYAFYVDLDLPELTVAINQNDEFRIQKILLLEKIKAYDSSEFVNQFSIQGQNLWLDKSTRVGLELRFKAEKQMLKETTILWQDGISFTLNIDDAINILYSLEIYASQCYDVTQSHISAINSLTTIDELKSYNYKTGYPSKLNL